MQRRCPAREGALVKIRCHCSQRCIVPLLGGAGLAHKVGIEFLPSPLSVQDVQEYTVLFACHALKPEQPPRWGCVVMPDFL